MSTVHRNLTGADLHEPKGADAALSGQVYVANGSGSGVWTDATTVITNTAFTTGDTKLTYKTVADSGWIIPQTKGTIGDGSSGATIRANADTSALFTLFWTNCSNTICPVSGGRGASAAADFAAHKTLTLPKITQRALIIAGGAGDLTSRTLGQDYGAETITLSTSNLPPYTPSGSVTGGVVSFPSVAVASSAGGGNSITLGPNSARLDQNAALLPSQTAIVFSGTAQGGTSTPFSIIQPSATLNLMIKL